MTRKTLNTLRHPDLSRDSLLASANYVREEFPIRLAHSIVEMQQLPYYVLSTDALQRVYRLYVSAFTSCVHFPRIHTDDDEREFNAMLESVITENTEVVSQIAVGIRQAKRRGSGLGAPEGDGLQGWVDRLMTSRVGNRVLAEQHLALHTALHGQDGSVPKNSRSGGRAATDGVIDMNTDVRECFARAADAAGGVCAAQYGVRPRVELKGAESPRIPYIRAHLTYSAFELLKNAMRATVEHYRAQNGLDSLLAPDVPEIPIFFAEGHRELTVRISDAGGGIPRKSEHLIFQYGYSTVDDTESDSALDVPTESNITTTGNVLGDALDRGKNNSRGSQLAGLGFGLPMSRYVPFEQMQCANFVSISIRDV